MGSTKNDSELKQVFNMSPPDGRVKLQIGQLFNNLHHFRAKNKVLDMTEKEQCKSCNLLYRYEYVVKERNPRSVCFLKMITPTLGAPARFQRFFITITIDSNNGVFPLPLCIAEVECKDSWGWFLEQLYLHKEVLDAIEKRWPNSNNRYSVRHLIANLQGRLIFFGANGKLKEVNPMAYDWMMTIPTKHWCVHAFDKHVKAAHTTNNITESFNGWVAKYRSELALTMLESIRRKMMKRMHKRLKDARKWSSYLPPLVMKKLLQRQDEGKFVTVLCASKDEFEEKDELKYFLVNLQTCSCNCGLWRVNSQQTQVQYQRRKLLR
ncbi:hypothetical protein ACOSQ2_003619 [Xanthoceras sorbifolium]